MGRHTFPAFLLLAPALCAQQNDVPLNRDFYIDVERNASQLDVRVFTGLKPVLEPRADLTNVLGHRVDSTRYYYEVTAKVLKEHLLEVREGGFHVTLDPLFQLELGRDLSDPSPYADTNQLFHNTRGLRIAGDLGPKLSFQTMFHENQAIVPQYLLAEIVHSGVVPGQGRVKIDNQRKLDWGWSMACLSYSPVRWLNVQLGHGKHFVGHGYRSVLLSDHAITAPYLKFSAMAKDRRWQYTTWHTRLMHGVKGDDRLPAGESSESLFWWMRGRFHHLAVRLGRVEVGLFEATLFQNIDDTGVKPFDPLELNPVIGVNSLVNGTNGPHTCIAGADLRVKLVDKAYAYGQWGTDQRGGGRAAWQAGLRGFDIGTRGLHVQLEYNAADAFLWMRDPPRMAYMHAGLPLAHPFGANFSEAVAILEYEFGHQQRFRVQGKVNLATRRRDRTPEANEGTDLNKPDLPAPHPDGPVQQDFTYLDLNAGWLLNPVSNLRVVAGVWRRDLTNAPDPLQSTHVYLSLRTALFNRYYDL